MTVALILFLLFFILFLGVPIAFGLGTIGLGLMIFGDISPKVSFFLFGIKIGS